MGMYICRSQLSVYRARLKRIMHRTRIASFSPILGVTNPRATLPTVIPSQNPVADIPLANGLACRTLSMNVTTHPPRPTSAPMYNSRKHVAIQVTRAAGIISKASFMRLPLASVVRGCFSRNRAPVDFQKPDRDTTSSMAAKPTYLISSAHSKGYR